MLCALRLMPRVLPCYRRAARCKLAGIEAFRWEFVQKTILTEARGGELSLEYKRLQRYAAVYPIIHEEKQPWCLRASMKQEGD